MSFVLLLLARQLGSIFKHSDASLRGSKRINACAWWQPSAPVERLYFQTADLSCSHIGHTCPIHWNLLCFWNATL